MVVWEYVKATPALAASREGNRGMGSFGTADTQNAS